ncbi:hypothetical protein ACJBTT_11075, partial [Streptococcus suis]
VTIPEVLRPYMGGFYVIKPYHLEINSIKKKLYKDRSLKELAGVIAGQYDYFNLYENDGRKLENVREVVILLAIGTNL